jgi:hypothetical protein
MAKLKLTAENAGQERVLKYLEENASDTLTEKINGGNKTMAGCWTYIVSRARSLAKNSCACVEDAEVYGWAVHYFEEDDLSKEKPEPAKKNEEVDPRIHERYMKTLEEKEEKARKEQEKMEALRKRNEEREERVRKKLEEEQRKKAGGIEGQLSLFDLLGGE